MKVKSKKNQVCLIIMSIVLINCNCALLMISGPREIVSIRSDEIELNNSISGRIGFCGVFYIPQKKVIFSTERYGSLFIVNNFHLYFSKDFLNVIYSKVTDDCKYDTIEDFSYFWDYFRQKPFSYQMDHWGAGVGYVGFYDEMDQHGAWRMWSSAVNFFNEHYNCDYYLTGKFYMNLTENSTKKIIEIEPNILLILYDNNGYRVWSKLYKKKYFSEEKNQLTPDTTYLFVKKMLDDTKEEINNDLMFKKIVEVGK